LLRRIAVRAIEASVRISAVLVDCRSVPSMGRGPMKVIVDHERCEGNARCVLAAPDVFALHDDDQAYVLIEHPDETLRPKIEQAVRYCPRQAISLIDD
jgi:ferredoxin